MGPQGTVALGVGYDLLKRDRRALLGVMVEARSLPTFSTQYTPIQTTVGTTETSNGTILAPSEWMLSLRSSPLGTDDVSITLGGGGALSTGESGLTAPRFRFLLGLRYAPTETKPAPIPPAGADHVAVPVAAPPVSEPGPVVTLGLGTKPDRCKDDPDSADGFKDDDGCPDEDADKDGIDDRYDRCPLQPEDFSGLAEGCPDAAKPAPPPPVPKKQ